MISSLNSEFSRTNTSRGPFPSTSTSATASASASSTNANGSASGTTTQTSSTFATSVFPTTGVSDTATQSLSTYASNTASNAASSTTNGPVAVSEKLSCNSVSCSSALQAAVAVPIIVAAIAAILLFFFCARSRRKRSGSVVNEKRPLKAGKKKWTRHLQAFSFDAELLMGGRFSSSNSIRSRDHSVQIDAGTSSHDGVSSAEPSMHSVDEVVPPYRDAKPHVTPPGPQRTIHAVTTIAADPIPRPLSTATAPPPYRSVAGGLSPEPASPSTVRNPFSDSTSVSPIEESPEAGGASATSLSHGTSTYRGVNTDDAATPTASEAGSIRKAMIGRRVSVKGSTGGGSN